MPDFILKQDYDRVVECLNTIITNEIYMRGKKPVIAYLIDLGFTDAELTKWFDIQLSEIAKVKSDIAAQADEDDCDYNPDDYPDLEPQDTDRWATQ